MQKYSEIKNAEVIALNAKAELNGIDRRIVRYYGWSLLAIETKSGFQIDASISHVAAVQYMNQQIGKGR